MGVKHYDKAFKEQAVKLSQQRDNINAVARELGISNYRNGAATRRYIKNRVFRVEGLNV